jgi:hypothetical protein
MLTMSKQSLSTEIPVPHTSARILLTSQFAETRTRLRLQTDRIRTDISVIIFRIQIQIQIVLNTDIDQIFNEYRIWIRYRTNIEYKSDIGEIRIQI